MNTGLGFTEMLLIVTLILLFFGSKELPFLLRDIAKFTAKVRRYSDRLKNELDEVTRSLDPQPVLFAEQKEKKKELRTFYIKARNQLTPEERSLKSSIICRRLMELEEVKRSAMIMMYVQMGGEVITIPAIEKLLQENKRIVIPYRIEGGNELGFAEIRNVATDIIIGKNKTPEPLPELRGKMFRSDIDLVVCPGVAFDLQGGRLGRGLGCYDTFLREFRGKIPLIGLAFDCQILKESLPFEYHDVAMDKVITESGTIEGGVLRTSGESTSFSTPVG